MLDEQNWISKMLSLGHFIQSSRLALSRFSRDRSGAIAVIFAVSIIPVMGMAAVALDYANATRIKTRAANALDAALLTAGSDPTLTPSQAKSLVESLFNANYGAKKDGETINVDASFSSGTGLTGTVAVDLPTIMSKLVGQDKSHINLQATVGAGNGSPVELVLVLDTTASMDGVKMDTLKTAATNLTNTLFATPLGQQGKVKVGIAPFDQFVNVDVANRGAAWLTNSMDYVDPVTPPCYDTYPDAVYGPEVTTPYACTLDGVPQTCYSYTKPLISAGTPVSYCPPAPIHQWWGCVGSRLGALDLTDTVTPANPIPALHDMSCGRSIMRLTNTQSTVSAKISALSTFGNTYIAPGLLWGWRLLSPNPPFGDGAPYGQAKKSIVLMTDGMNTYSANPDGNHWSHDTAAADTNLSNTCNAVKNQGIRIFTVAFSVTDPGIKNVLKQCASANSDFYDSISTSDLTSAFASISTKLTRLRLVK